MQANGNSDYKNQVLAAINIVELIGQTVALKKRGRDFVGLCPFHSEKTPSFKVDPAKQYFYCFGCKAAGNAIDFVIKRDRIEFIDALRQLGQQAGIEMPRFGISKQKTDEKNLLIEAHSAAAAFFENCLKDPQAGAPAREYLAKRGITPQTAARFRIGVAPDSWDALLRSSVARKFSPETLAAGGLVKIRENGSGYYDTFRNRLMFPIRDSMGRIIAFGGRVMPGSTDPAKYLNSPETQLFNKSACVFGIDLGARRIVETQTAVIVEGYTDVVMAHQFDVSNVVSVLGTAMTVQHLGILRRLANKIILLFDPDTAGDLAVDRVVELFLTQPVEIAIASLPSGVDPDEYLLAHGKEAFAKVLAEAVDILAFKWKQLSRQYASKTRDMTGQQAAVEKYLKLLADARGSGPVDPLRWGAALTQVSRLTEMPVDTLNSRFKTRRLAPPRTAAGAANAGPADASLPQTSSSRQNTAREAAERHLLGSLLIDPDRWDTVQVTVRFEDFTHPLLKRLAQTFWEHKRDEGVVVFKEFLGLLSEPALVELAIELFEEVSLLHERSSLDATLDGAMGYLQQQHDHGEEQKLMGQLRRTSDDRDLTTGNTSLEDASLATAFLTKPGTTVDTEGNPATDRQAAEGISDAHVQAEQEAPVEAQQDQQHKLNLFKEFVKKHQSTDLRRLGPVRRSRS